MRLPGEARRLILPQAQDEVHVDDTYPDDLLRSILASVKTIALVGASANLTVAGISERNGVPFRFLTYTLYAAPLTIVSIAICNVYVWWRYF